MSGVLSIARGATEADVVKILAGQWKNDGDCENHASEKAFPLNRKYAQLRFSPLGRDGFDLFSMDIGGKEMLKLSTANDSIIKHIPHIAKAKVSAHYFLGAEADSSSIILRSSVNYRELTRDKRYVRETLQNISLKFSFIDEKRLVMEEGSTTHSATLNSNSRESVSITPSFDVEYSKCWFTKK